MTSSRNSFIALLYGAAIELVLGATFVVSYVSDVPFPGSSNFLVLGICLMLAGLVMVYLGLRDLRLYRTMRRLREEGVQGQAQVQESARTGWHKGKINRQLQFSLKLRITTQVHGTYDATVREYVPRVSIDRLRSGVPLAVKVDRDDRDTLMIDWSNSGAVRGGHLSKGMR